MTEQPNSAQDVLVEMWNNHAATVGRIAIGWNALHEELGYFFVSLATPNQHEAGWAAWHALKVDRAQRDMLQAVLLVCYDNDDPRQEAITWALNQIKPLEDRRNTAVHATYGLVIEDGAFRLIPTHFTGHPRSLKLKDRDLETELIHYKDHITRIRQYLGLAIPAALARHGEHPLPPKPKLPLPAHRAPRGAEPRRTPRKGR